MNCPVPCEFWAKLSVRPALWNCTALSALLEMSAPCSDNSRKHFCIIVNLRAGEIPTVVCEVIAVADFIEFNRSIKVVFQGLNITEYGLGCAGNIEVFVKVSLPHRRRKGRTIRVAVLFQLGNQPNQSL